MTQPLENPIHTSVQDDDANLSQSAQLRRRSLDAEDLRSWRASHLPRQLLEPWLTDVKSLPGEATLFEAAHEFVMRERQRLGISEPLPEIACYLRELWSSTGFSGLADAKSRTAFRAPSITDDCSDWTYPLWVHEISHTTGRIHLQSGGDSFIAPILVRSGAALYPRNIANSVLGLGFEEYAASAYHMRALEARGYVRDLRPVEHNLDLASHLEPEKLPRLTELVNSISSKLEASDLPMAQALRKYRGSYYPEITPERLKVFVPRLNLTLGTAHLNGIYDGLVWCLDTLAQEIFSELSPLEAAQKFRDLACRAQAGSPLHELTRPLKVVLGNDGLLFLLNLGNAEQCFTEVEQIEVGLLGFFVFAGILEPTERQEFRGFLRTIQESWIESRRDLNEDPSDRANVVKEKILSASTAFQLNHAAQGVDLLVNANINYAELDSDSVRSLLRPLARLSADHREILIYYFVRYNVIHPTQLDQYEQDRTENLQKISGLAYQGIFSQVLEIVNYFGLSPECVLATCQADLLFVGIDRVADLGELRASIQLADFLGIAENPRLSPATQKRLQNWLEEVTDFGDPMLKTLVSIMLFYPPEKLHLSDSPQVQAGWRRVFDRLLGLGSSTALHLLKSSNLNFILNETEIKFITLTIVSEARGLATEHAYTPITQQMHPHQTSISDWLAILPGREQLSHWDLNTLAQAARLMETLGWPESHPLMAYHDRNASAA